LEEKVKTYYVACCGHTFTTAQSLKRHKESPSHRRITDPEFAKTEAAEKAVACCGHTFTTAQSLKRHNPELMK
jgi:hypothetical protein